MTMRLSAMTVALLAESGSEDARTARAKADKWIEAGGRPTKTVRKPFDWSASKAPEIGYYYSDGKVTFNV